MVSEMMVAISAYIPVHTNLQMCYNRNYLICDTQRSCTIYFSFLNILIRSPGSHNSENLK